MAKFEITITRTYQKSIVVECPSELAGKYNMIDKLENATRKLLTKHRGDMRTDVNIEFGPDDLVEDQIEVYERPSDIDFVIGEDDDDNLEFHPSYQ